MTDATVQTIGRYRLIKQIGRGGMAAVHKAYDPAQDRYVALKVLYPYLADDRQFSRRFRREAKVVMGLKHPNIVPVEDFGEVDGSAYLVMPLLDMGSLADRLQEGPLTLQEGSTLLEQIASALQFAHDQGVVHRDVKPSNILLGRDGAAFLADFGLASVQDASVNLTGSALLGTPAYMSPEQAQGVPADPRSDQYALAVILYQLSTGTLPFDAETPMAVVLQHINEPLPLARSRSPEVPDSVERVILKATAKAPDDRFVSVSAMSRAFKEAVAYALDPTINPAPTLELPASLSGNRATLIQGSDQKKNRRRTGLLALLLLLLVGIPFTCSPLRNTIAMSAAGGPLSISEMNEAQLTELAVTIDAMSTQLAIGPNGTRPAENIPTLVMETLAAAGQGPLASATLASGSLGTEETSTPGSSVTPSQTAYAGVTGIPSTLPTVTPAAVASSTTSPFPSSTPTLTVPSATHTLIPSATSTPTPTKTPSSTPLPSATPTFDVCSLIVLGTFGQEGDDRLRIAVLNNSSLALRIDSLYLDWDPALEELKEIKLDSQRIWDVDDTNPPSNVPAEGPWKGNEEDRTISAFDADNLIFKFDQDIESLEASLQLTFNNGCVISN